MVRKLKKIKLVMRKIFSLFCFRIYRIKATFSRGNSMNKENIENSIFIKYHKISKWKKIKEWFRKKCSRNKKNVDKELENKNNLYNFIKNNPELVSLFIPFMVFLIDAFLSLNIAMGYNIPVRFVEIDMKIFVVFFIIFSSPLVYIYFFRGKFDKKASFFLLTFLEIVFLLTIIINRPNILYIVSTFFKEKIWGIYLFLILLVIVIILVNSLSIFFKIVVYIMVLIGLFSVKAEWGEIITLKNGETKIVVGYSEGEYLVADYEIEKTLRGYEKPKYIISLFNVQKSELRKFNEVIFFDLQKEKEVGILILNNGGSKIAKEYYDYKYKAYDYTIEENLKIYKKPVYKISSSDISEVELKKFKAINSFDLSKGVELQIITLNDGKQRVILSKPNGEYGAFDFEKEDGKLIIYKIPSYEIITSEIKNIESPKEFEKVEYKNFMLVK